MWSFWPELCAYSSDLASLTEFETLCSCDRAVIGAYVCICKRYDHVYTLAYMQVTLLYHTGFVWSEERCLAPSLLCMELLLT